MGSGGDSFTTRSASLGENAISTTEVMVDVIEADLQRVIQLFKTLNLPIVGIQEITVED